MFGNSLAAAINETLVLEWLGGLRADGRPKSSIKLYFELLDAILAAMVRDRIRSDNPCAGIRLAKILDGLSITPKWVPTPDQVLRLLDAMPARYRLTDWLGAAGSAPRRGARHGGRRRRGAVGRGPTTPAAGCSTAAAVEPASRPAQATVGAAWHGGCGPATPAARRPNAEHGRGARPCQPGLAVG
ncbi:hypothetical protein [Dactylosporangium sp. CA-092794]|uniref:hypothetical protein n=1 Tax=Dactylosporangium sp. CA-092794 TaxID=3239929 RepID=UPI003D8EB076